MQWGIESIRPRGANQDPHVQFRPMENADHICDIRTLSLHEVLGMPDVLVREIPEPVLEELRSRARRSRRSLQQEILTVLEAAVDARRMRALLAMSSIRERLARTGRTFGDSADLVREDRER